MCLQTVIWAMRSFYVGVFSLIESIFVVFFVSPEFKLASVWKEFFLGDKARNTILSLNVFGDAEAKLEN